MGFFVGRKVVGTVGGSCCVFSFYITCFTKQNELAGLNKNKREEHSSHLKNCEVQWFALHLWIGLMVTRELKNCHCDAQKARLAGRRPSAEVQFPDGLEKVAK